VGHCVHVCTSTSVYVSACVRASEFKNTPTQLPLLHKTVLTFKNYYKKMLCCSAFERHETHAQ